MQALESLNDGQVRYLLVFYLLLYATSATTSASLSNGFLLFLLVAFLFCFPFGNGGLFYSSSPLLLLFNSFEFATFYFVVVVVGRM